MCLGIATLILVDLGPSSWDAFSGGLSEKLNISFGMATSLSGILIVFICALFNRELPNWKPILMNFITGFIIDFWIYIITLSGLFQLDLTIWILLFIAFLAMLLMAIGINLYVKADIAPNAIDYLMLTISNNFKLSFGKAKILTDLTGLLFALLVSGPVGPFTFIIITTLGIFVGLFEKLYYKLATKKIIFD